MLSFAVQEYLSACSTLGQVDNKTIYMGRLMGRHHIDVVIGIGNIGILDDRGDSP
jgi:hypothetical protein